MSSPTRSSRTTPGGEGGPSSLRRSVLVGVAGGSGSGKTTVVREVVRALGPGTVSVIEHDAYYRDLSDLPYEERVTQNFDHPGSLETDLLVGHVRELLSGRPVEVPTYDFASHTRRRERRRVTPTPVVVLDGILVLADSDLRGLMDLSVFVHAGAEERLARRLRRDTLRRGRSAESVLEQYRATVRPMHDRYVEPTRAYADVTILEGGHNRRAVAQLVGRVEDLIRPPVR